MIALKNTAVSDDVFGRESIVGDIFVRGIEINQQPSNVACVIVRMHKPNREGLYQTQESKKALRIEIRNKRKDPPQTSGAVGLNPGSPPEVATALSPHDQETESTDLFVLQDGPASRDTDLLKEAMAFFRAEKWNDAVSSLEKIVRSYPKSRHLESVHFLLAKSCHQKFKNQIADHLIDIVQQYQVAVSTFPKSKHVPDAFLAMGNCYFQANQYHEAMTYYSLVSEKYEKDRAAPEAMLQRGRALAMTQKPLLALRYFETLGKQYPESSSAAKARLEMAKTLFDLKSFKRSLKILKDFSRAFPDEIYKNSDILLYTGYNYYELGQLGLARDVLSKALNYFPQLETTDLILTRIADTLREDGMASKAMKLYDLVARTYPDSEGSVISLIRVAEEAEKAGNQYPVDPDEEVPEEKASKSAQEIYQQIIERFPDSPLAHVVMLKLGNLEKKAKRYEEAIRLFRDLLARQPDGKLRQQIETALQDAMLKFAGVYSKDGLHEKSVSILKELLAQYPQTTFRAEVKASIEGSLDTIFRKHKQAGNIEGLISYYEELKAYVPFEDMPNLLLQISDAYRELHLYGSALSLLQKARPFYGKNDLPSHALMGLVECAFKEEEFDEAKRAGRAFVNKYPTHQRVSEAYLVLGEVLLMRRDYHKSFKFLNIALTRNPDTTTRVGVLLAMGKVSNALGDHDGAARSLKEAIALLQKANGGASDALALAYGELGETRVRQGAKQKALVSFRKALELHPQGPKVYGLQFRLAQCYQWTKARDKAQEMLTRIVASGDPFWSKVAQTQINEMNIEDSMETINMGLNKS
jgi:TolA-binding protein